MKIAPAAIAALLALTGCSGSAQAEPTPASVAADQVAQFEADNAIDTSDWYGHVVRTEIQFGNSLWVHTDLDQSAKSKNLAKSMCGAYSQYVLVDENVTVTFVRAESGLQLAKCGPGA